MNVDTFLEQFGHLADAPDGIKKLRELVLDLAVRGKLVEQDLEDESAAKLRELLEKKREQLIKEKIIKRSKPLPPIEINDLNFSIPIHWTLLYLDSICSLVTDGEHQTPERVENGEFPLATAKNIRDGYVELKNTDTVTKETATRCWKRCLPSHNDILMVCVGATTGRLCVLRDPSPFVIVRSVALFRPFTEFVLPGFLATVLRSTFGQKQIWQGVRQSAQPCLYINKSRAIKIPLPPLAEQKRIVAKVDELMTLCDELETQQQQRQTVHAQLTTASLHQLTTAETPRQLTKAWQRIDTQFDQLFTTRESIEKLRQTILQLAVQGKLVPQNETSPVVQLSELLAENSLNGYSKKPDINPIGTQILRISAATSRSDAIVDEADYRYVSLTETEKTKFGLQPGDLLACRFNGNLHYVARFAIYQGYSNGLQIYPDKLIRFRLNLKKAIPEYIRYTMNSRQTRDSIEKMCATTAGNIGISATKLKTIAIPVPTISVQKRIVSKVDHMMKLCDQLEIDLEVQETNSSNLSSAITSEVLN